MRLSAHYPWNIHPPSLGAQVPDPISSARRLKLNYSFLWIFSQHQAQGYPECDGDLWVGSVSLRSLRCFARGLEMRKYMTRDG